MCRLKLANKVALLGSYLEYCVITGMPNLEAGVSLCVASQRAFSEGKLGGILAEVRDAL